MAGCGEHPGGMKTKVENVTTKCACLLLVGAEQEATRGPALQDVSPPVLLDGGQNGNGLHLQPPPPQGRAHIRKVESVSGCWREHRERER